MGAGGRNRSLLCPRGVISNCCVNSAYTCCRASPRREKLGRGEAGGQVGSQRGG